MTLHSCPTGIVRIMSFDLSRSASVEHGCGCFGDERTSVKFKPFHPWALCNVGQAASRERGGEGETQAFSGGACRLLIGGGEEQSSLMSAGDERVSCSGGREQSGPFTFNICRSAVWPRGVLHRRKAYVLDSLYTVGFKDSTLACGEWCRAGPGRAGRVLRSTFPTRSR